MIGPKLAQISLSFGADDIDGTVIEERITHMAGAETAQAMTREEILHLIREAGREPVERDTLYNTIVH
jgi:aminodeoxyfutalosine synthase